MAEAWRAGADTGNAKAAANVKRLNDRIDTMTRMRQYWANVAQRQLKA